MGRLPSIITMASLALARAYQQSFDTHPYATLAFTNGILNAFGDGVAQTAQRVVRHAYSLVVALHIQPHADCKPKTG